MKKYAILSLLLIFAQPVWADILTAEKLPPLPYASMDHRGLAYAQGWFYLVGGMLDPQIVSDRVYKFRPAPFAFNRSTI